MFATLVQKSSMHLDKILPALLAFFLPIAGILIAVGGFIILDTIIGVWKAKKLKEKVTSKKLSKVIQKMLVYQLVVITFFLLDCFIVNDFILTFFSIQFALTKVIAIILISIEVFSIDESFGQATGLGLFGHLTKLIRKLKNLKGESDGLKNKKSK